MQPQYDKTTFMTMNFSKHYRKGYLISVTLIILLMSLWLFRELGFFYISWPEDLITPALLFAMIGLSFVILERGQEKGDKDDQAGLE